MKIAGKSHKLQITVCVKKWTKMLMMITSELWVCKCAYFLNFIFSAVWNISDFPKSSYININVNNKETKRPPGL